MRDFIPGQSAIYPDQAQALNDLIRRFGTDKGQVQPGTEGPQEYITAKITGTTTGGYAWTEQIPDPTDGTLSDKPGGMSDTTLGPAVELNGSVPASYPYYCELYFRAMSQDGPVYVFELTGSGVTIPDAAYNVSGKINTSDQFFGDGKKYFADAIGITLGTDTTSGQRIYSTADGVILINGNVDPFPSDPPAVNTANAIAYVGAVEGYNGSNSGWKFNLDNTGLTLSDTSTTFYDHGFQFNGNGLWKVGQTNTGMSPTDARPRIWSYMNSSTLTLLVDAALAGALVLSCPFGETGITTPTLNLNVTSALKILDGTATLQTGQSTTAGGLTFTKGILTGGSFSGGVSIGDVIGGSPTPGGLLLTNDDDELIQGNLNFNITDDLLTIGASGSGIGTLVTNQIGIPTSQGNNTITGPFIYEE